MRTAVVTSHYNWFGFQKPVQNLFRFLDHYKDHEVFGLELIRKDFGKVTEGLEGWKQTTVTESQVFMQKEAALNLVVRGLPKEFDTVVWLDADVLLEEGWLEKTQEALRRHKVVQPYSKAVWLNRTGTGSMDERPGIAKARGEGLHRCVAHPGFAFAARRELWEQGGLPSQMFLGNGDVVFAAGVFGVTDLPVFQLWSSELRDQVSQQIENLKNFTGSNGVGFVEGCARHLWHGDIRDRKYTERYKAYARFDPVRHMEVQQNGLPGFTRSAPFFLRSFARTHFASRKEDG